MPIRGSTRSLALLRARARAPRVALLAAAAVIAGAGIKTLVAPATPAAPQVTVTRQPTDYAELSAAERAARTLVDGKEARIVGQEERGRGLRVITVAVGAEKPINVAVLVTRDSRGRIVVYDPPAIVGLPGSDTRGFVGGREVDDEALTRVVARAMRNYLRGEHDDLAADLAPGVDIAVPRVTLTPRPLDRLTWVVPGRSVAAALSARLASGDLVDLRYELGVRRLAQRWLITQVHVNPLHQEVRP